MRKLFLAGACLVAMSGVAKAETVVCDGNVQRAHHMITIETDFYWCVLGTRVVRNLKKVCTPNLDQCRFVGHIAEVSAINAYYVDKIDWKATNDPNFW